MPVYECVTSSRPWSSVSPPAAATTLGAGSACAQSTPQAATKSTHKNLDCVMGFGGGDDPPSLTHPQQQHLNNNNKITQYQSNSSNTDLTSPLIHSVTRTLPGTFEGRWLVCVCHTCRQKLRGVSSESQKSYSGLGPCWPSAAGGRELSQINTLTNFGKPAAVTVVTV